MPLVLRLERQGRTGLPLEVLVPPARQQLVSAERAVVEILLRVAPVLAAALLLVAPVVAVVAAANQLPQRIIVAAMAADLALIFLIQRPPVLPVEFLLATLEEERLLDLPAAAGAAARLTLQRRVLVVLEAFPAAVVVAAGHPLRAARRALAALEVPALSLCGAIDACSVDG